MDVLVVGSWLIIIPVRIVYIIWLYGVTVNNTDMSEGGFKFMKHPTTYLAFAGAMWLWSNMGVGLIYLQIRSIVYETTDDLHRKQNNNNVNEDSNRGRYVENIYNVLCLLQSIVGIMWLWSHEKLFYLSLFAFAIYATRITLIYVGILQDKEDDNKEIRDEDSWIRTFLFCTLLVSVWLFVRYEEICNFSNDFWRRMFHYITRRHDLHSNIVVEDRTTHSSRQIMIGQNINHSGILTVGDVKVSIADFIFHIQEHGVRDIYFINLVTRDKSWSFFSCLSLLAFSVLVFLTCSLFSGFKTTTETSSQFSCLEQE